MKTLNVVCAIIIKDKKILACQRNYGEFKGLWEFPGGKIENGESNHEALTREINEELSLNINIHNHFETIYHEYPNFRLVMHAYICSIESGTLVTNEHNSIKWLSSNNLDSLTWLEADIILINKLKNYNF